jgi:hypothetical protein
MLTTPRARRAWASPKFFLLRLNRRRTAYLRAGLPTFRLTYVPAYQRSGLPTRHQLFLLLGFSHRPSPVQAEHLSFSFM